MVRLALRAGPLLALAAKPTVPLPFPELPEVTVSHDALLLAVHVQPVGTVTATLLLPAEAVNEALVGANVELHDSAAWLTVTVFPPTLSVAERAAPVLAATE